MSTAPRPPRPAVASAAAAAAPLTDAERDELQALLDDIPAPLEPLDVAMLDGYLCGLLVQPQPVPAARWLPHVTDVDGRPLPGRLAGVPRLHALVMRRHAELERAIAARTWFDPWVFELEADDAALPTAASTTDAESDDVEDGDDEWQAEVDTGASQAVYPWVAGFATALELFPGLMRHGTPAAVTEPLALLYRHLEPDDLEDADELLETIDSLEPPADLAEAVEGLVRATLLLADVGRPLRKPGGPRPVHPARRGGPRRR